ncbi:MAG: hypothetical protein RJA07_487 [Bacteroidota bacterium]|jgi:hypothetical protein
MICNRVSKSNVIGNTDLPLQPLIDSVLLFIDKYLPTFQSSLVQSQIDAESETEKLLNQQLIDFFNGHSPDFNQYLQYRFIFRKDDESKGTNYKPDIGITIWNKEQLFSEVQSFFQIECKRLPTPNISNSRSEKEYVKGIEKNTGGIERFKNNKHGNHLEQAALIGFVQNDLLQNWHNKIKDWIQYEIDNTNSSWTVDDHLKISYQKNSLHRYHSICNRILGKPITLHHFFIDISKKK